MAVAKRPTSPPKRGRRPFRPTSGTVPLDAWASITSADCVDRLALLRFVCAPRPLKEYAEALRVHDEARLGLRSPIARFGKPPLPRSRRLAASDYLPDRVYWRRLQLIFEAARPLRESAFPYRSETVVEALSGRFSMKTLGFLAPLLGCEEGDLLHFAALFGHAEQHWQKEHVDARPSHRGFDPDLEPWLYKTIGFGKRPKAAAGISPAAILAHVTGFKILQAQAVQGWPFEDKIAKRLAHDDVAVLTRVVPPGLELELLRTGYVAVDIDCHVESLKLETGKTVALDKASVRRRLDACERAFRAPAALVVSSPSRVLAPSSLAFWKIQGEPGAPALVARWAHNHLRASGIHLQGGWIEVPERYRLPLGYRSQVLDPESLEPLFQDLSWDTRGKELGELRRRMPLATPESYQAGLFDDGIPAEIVDLVRGDESWRRDLPRARRAKTGSPVAAKEPRQEPVVEAADVGDEPPEVQLGASGVPTSVATRAKEIREKGLTEPGQFNDAVKTLNLYNIEGLGMTPEESAEEIVAVLMLNADGTASDSVRRGELWVRRRAREVAFAWAGWKAEHGYTPWGRRHESPDKAREAVLRQRPQDISTVQVEDILSLNLRQKKQGRARGHLDAERVLAFLIALMPVRGRELTRAGKVVGTVVPVAYALRLDILPRYRLEAASATLQAVVHPETGSPLLSVHRDSGPQWDYLVGAPLKVGGKGFACLESALVGLLGEKGLARYSSDNQELIQRRAEWARAQGRPINWWDACLRNPAGMPGCGPSGG